MMGKNTLLVTAAVWRDPQLTVTTSHDVETSSSAGKAWIDMNTSSFSSPPSASEVEDAPAGEYKLLPLSYKGIMFYFCVVCVF